MKQRLGIANAILHDPELLILDEPTNGLDPIGIAEVRDFIKTLSIERGKTILISSHILSEIALLADDIGIIDHGVLLEENSMNELQKKTVSIYFCKFLIYRKLLLFWKGSLGLPNIPYRTNTPCGFMTLRWIWLLSIKLLWYRI